METELRPRPHVARARWAAIGAAVAVALGAGGLSIVGAHSGPEPVGFVAVGPERIADTRSGLGLGQAITAGTPQSLQVTGPITTQDGTRTLVPAGSTAVVATLTAVEPTGDGFMAVRPGDATGLPTTSQLNMVAGSIVATTIIVPLAADGTLDLAYVTYTGVDASSDLLLDITGYFGSGHSGYDPGKDDKGDKGDHGGEGEHGEKDK